MSFSDYPTVIHKGGHYVEDPTILLYEKTTSDVEEVVGRFGAPGTANNQVKLWSTGKTVAGIFLKQRKHMPFVSNKPSSNHAEHDQDVDFAASGIAYFLARMKRNQTINKGDAIQPENGTGLALVHTTGPTCAVAAETVTTPVGAEGWILCWLKTPSVPDLDTP